MKRAPMGFLASVHQMGRFNPAAQLGCVNSSPHLSPRRRPPTARSAPLPLPNPGHKKAAATAVSSHSGPPGLPPFRDLPWQDVDALLKRAGLVSAGWRYSSAKVFVRRGSRASAR